MKKLSKKVIITDKGESVCIKSILRSPLLYILELCIEASLIDGIVEHVEHIIINVLKLLILVEDDVTNHKH